MSLKIMQLRAYAVSLESKFEFIAQAEFDALRLTVMAESREQMAMKNGRDWTAGAVSFFAQRMITAINAGNLSADIELEAMNVAMSAWLCESIFDRITAEQFLQSDIVVTILPCGAVVYERVPAGTTQFFELLI